METVQTGFSFENCIKMAEYIKNNSSGSPKTAVVLGSGLGALAGHLEDPSVIRYRDIPGFPVSTVASHAGRLYTGRLGKRECLMMSGRFHYYEGWSPEDAAGYIRVLKLLGIQQCILTNAAGCINGGFSPGDLMLVCDHINFTGLSPCRGPNDGRFGERFFDMSGAYSPKLREAAKACAHKLGVTLREGVYAYMTGPQYETPAEIRALRILGADAVGMSTVPEVIEAAHCGLETLCFSILTNYAAGMDALPLADADVVKTAGKSSESLARILTEMMEGTD